MILDLIFPKKCVGCGKSGGYVCGVCISKVKYADVVCPNCNRPSIDGAVHFKCKKPLGLDGTTTIYAYEKVMVLAIKKMKYQFASEIAKELAVLCILNIRKLPFYSGSNYILVPIPTHKKRKNWRGFNQSEVMGKLISEKMGWKYSPDLLIKKKATNPQTELKGKERKINIRGGFVINSHYSSFDIHNPIILFDDVLTTGSTLKEACKVLKSSLPVYAGRRRQGKENIKVWGLTVAK